MEIIIAPAARADIVAILDWSQEQFGDRTASRYQKLIQTAIKEVASDPELPGSSRRDEILANCRTYHLSCCRKKAGRRGDRIRHPRHFLLYRMSAEGVVEIGRVLHDSMDLDAHLPEEYRHPE
jgi:toxin ParE1/3/4